MAKPHPDAHRLEIYEADLHVRVSQQGTVLAETRRPVVLKEGKLPTRYYIPREDVRMGRLTRSDTSTHCPFKGEASYWSVDGVPDAAWSYDAPIPGAEPIAGLICFYSEKVELSVGSGRS